MGSYKLSEAAKADLIRIYHYGLRKFGETQADNYFYAFFERFQKIAGAPLRYPSAFEIREGYRRSVCGVDSTYYIVNADNTINIMSIIDRQDVNSWL